MLKESCSLQLCEENAPIYTYYVTPEMPMISPQLLSRLFRPRTPPHYLLKVYTDDHYCRWLVSIIMMNLSICTM